ncbi:MAG TPA: hypothetical protein VIT92_00800, partial [Burkholderiaceae bacterium]
NADTWLLTRDLRWLKRELDHRTLSFALSQGRYSRFDIHCGKKICDLESDFFAACQKNFTQTIKNRVTAEPDNAVFGAGKTGCEQNRR